MKKKLKNVTKILKEKKISQSALAKKLSINPASVSLYVRGLKPFPTKHAGKIEKILGVKVA